MDYTIGVSLIDRFSDAALSFFAREQQRSAPSSVAAYVRTVQKAPLGSHISLQTTKLDRPLTKIPVSDFFGDPIPDPDLDHRVLN